MLIRVRGGTSGIKEYLEKGLKSGRDYSRDELDERIILAGDLAFTDELIKNMTKTGERYLHITLSFKEDNVATETLQEITDSFKDFAMSAYQPDEYHLYAEAHLPKLKSYAHVETGERVERKPHIHIVIPQFNLLSQQNLNPFGKVEQQTQFLEAFQEHINATYGLASPKENRRTQFTDESTIITRYKGDTFKGANKELKEKLLNALLDKNITSLNDFKELAKHYGAIRIRNEGKPNAYLNIKPEGHAKGINLKEYVFSQDFLSLSASEKKQKLAQTISLSYEQAQDKKTSDAEYEKRLKTWHKTHAREVKYINSGNRGFYKNYKNASVVEKQKILKQREDAFYQKYRHKEEPAHDIIPEHTRERHLNGIRENLRTAEHHLESAGRAIERPESAKRGFAYRCLVRVLRTLGLGRKRHQVETQQPKSRERDGRVEDSVVSQFVASHQEEKLVKRQEVDFATIKKNLDASLLLAWVSKSHGAISQKYTITKAADGSERIRCGSRHLNVSDFLTKELHLPWQDAAPLLQAVYGHQCQRQKGRVESLSHEAPRPSLWKAYRETWLPEHQAHRAKAWNVQKASELARRQGLREAYQASKAQLQQNRRLTATKRKSALSVLRMNKVEQDMLLSDAIKKERADLKAAYNKKPYGLYIDFLVERANQADNQALEELRRLHAPDFDAPSLPSIETGNKVQLVRLVKEAVPASTHYRVDHHGNVTYFNNTKALFIDEGRSVRFAKNENDESTLEAGVRLALTKFGGTLHVSGSESYKESIVDIVVKRGFKVQFSDEALNTLCKEKSAQLAQGKAFIKAHHAKHRETKVTHSRVQDRNISQDLER